MMEFPEIQANSGPSVGRCILDFHKGPQGRLSYPLPSTYSNGFLVYSHNPLQYELLATLQATADDVALPLPSDRGQ